MLSIDVLLISETLALSDEVVDCSIGEVIDKMSKVLIEVLIVVVGRIDDGILTGVLIVVFINVEISSVEETNTDGVIDVIIILELAGRLTCELLVETILDAVIPSDDARISVVMSKSVLKSIIIGIVEVGETESKQLSEKFTSSIDKSSSLRFVVTLKINCIAD